MGIRELWDIVNAIEDKGPLENFVAEDHAHGRRGDERVIIGIDASDIMSQCTPANYTESSHGASPLESFFYKLKHFTRLEADVVCVFDANKHPLLASGAQDHPQPPCYAFCETFAENLGYHVHKAPGSGKAELAALNEHGFIDYVLTSDSDVFPFGARNVLRSIMSDKPTAAANFDANSLYRSELLESGAELDKAGLILYALLAGGDHTDGVDGFSKKIAFGLAQCGLGTDLYQASIRFEDDPIHLQGFISTWLRSVQDELQTNAHNYLKEPQPTLATHLTEATFPSAEVVLMYARPVTSFSHGKQLNVETWLTGEGGISISGLAHCFRERLGWTYPQIHEGFYRHIWEGVFRQMIHSPEREYDAESHMLLTDEYSVRIIGVEEREKRRYQSLKRWDVIDSWYEVCVCIEPFIEELNDALIDMASRNNELVTRSPDSTDSSLFTPHTQMVVCVPEMYCPRTLEPFLQTDIQTPSAGAMTLPRKRKVSFLSLFDGIPLCPSTRKRTAPPLVQAKHLED